MRLPARLRVALAAAALLLPAAAPAGAQTFERPWTAGARGYLMWSGPGTLVGDIQGHGVFVAYRVRPRWSVRTGYDRLYYDQEEPVEATDVVEADREAVDPFVRVHRLRADVVLHFREGRRFMPWLSAGAAWHETAANEKGGVTADGGTYHLVMDTPSTIGGNVEAGIDLRVARRYAFGLATTYGRTAEGPTVTDEVSGSSGEIEALRPWGFMAQATVRF